MYQQVVKNEYGEPMYVENVMDAQEEYDAYCEEMQHRADDPWYAAQCESEYWYRRACAAFEAEGIAVPQEVINILARELHSKKAKEEEEKEIAKAMPVVNLFNQFFPNMCYARYNPPTPAEIGYVEIDFYNWSERPYRDEVEKIFELAYQQNIDVDDFISIRDFKERK